MPHSVSAIAVQTIIIIICIMPAALTGDRNQLNSSPISFDLICSIFLLFPHSTKLPLGDMAAGNDVNRPKLDPSLLEVISEITLKVIQSHIKWR